MHRTGYCCHSPIHPLLLCCVIRVFCLECAWFCPRGCFIECTGEMWFVELDSILFLFFPQFSIVASFLLSSFDLVSPLLARVLISLTSFCFVFSPSPFSDHICFPLISFSLCIMFGVFLLLFCCLPRAGSKQIGSHRALV